MYHNANNIFYSESVSKYAYLLYTHQCIAQNTDGTQQWNTDKWVAFSASPQSVSCWPDV